MGKATYLQTSFLAGEWSPFYQGRVDHPKYRTAMAMCYNGMPMEEGAWTRRPGTNWVNWTRNGAAAKLLTYVADDHHTYTLEMTNGHVRFINSALFQGINYVYSAEDAAVTAISTDNPAKVTVSPAVTWATGDVCYFVFENFANPTKDLYLHPEIAKPLRGRQVKITKVNTTNFTIQDAVTGANIDGAAIAWDNSKAIATMAKVLDFSGAWTTSDLKNLRITQNERNGFIFDGVHPIQQLDFLPNPTDFVVQNPIASGSITQLDLQDGPYLDRYPTSAHLTVAYPGASMNLITLTPSYPAYDAAFSYSTGAKVTAAGIHYVSLIDSNLANTPASSPTDWQVSDGKEVWTTAYDLNTVGLTSASVGRLIRLFSQPKDWSSSDTYAAGDAVTYPTGSQSYYKALRANSAVVPGASPSDWVVVDALQATLWVWGTITAINTTTQVATVDINTALLYAVTVSIRYWRLGAFGGPLAWPTCGVFHENRLWLGGAIPNRFDASMSGQFNVMSPTAPDGTVADNHAISDVLLAEGINKIQWMNSQESGILCGTLGGEFMIQPNQQNDPLTPTNVKGKRVTSYKAANVEPVTTGLSLVFVQALRHKLQEFLPDVFSGKYSAPNLSLVAKHLSKTGIQQIAYQEETVPIVWSLMTDGSITGTSYRRTSSFTSEEASMAAWHKHSFDGGNVISSIAVGEPHNSRYALTTFTQEPPDSSGVTNSLNYVGYDSTASAYYVGALNLVPMDTPRLVECAYLDMVGFPWGAYTGTSGGNSGIYVTGLWHLNGKTVSAFVAGLDCGTFTVASGEIFVPYQSDSGQLFTLAYAQALWTAEQALLPNFLPIYKGAGSAFYGFVGTSAISDGTTLQAGIPIVVGLPFTSQGQMLPTIAPQEAGSRTGPALGNVRRTNKVTMAINAGITGTMSVGTAPLGAAPGTAIPNAITAIFTATDEVTALASNVLFNGNYKDSINDTYSKDSMISWQITRPLPLSVLAVQGFVDTAEE